MKYDAILIGAGQANPFLAADFAEMGQKVALIEGHKIGGSCVNYGCIPSKMIIASARVAYLARRGSEFGVNTGPVHVDMNKVIDRKAARVEDAQSGMDGWMRGVENIDVYDGYGKFESAGNGLHRVRVGDQILEAERVYLNTGTRSFVPEIKGLSEVNYMDNRDILELRELPDHLIVLGGGYIGLEFGQAFRRFGSEVTIIESLPYVLPNEDEDISIAVREILENEGVNVMTGCRAIAASQADNGTITVTLAIDNDGKQMEIKGSHLLLAVGRKPNTDNLNLEAVGAQVDSNGYIAVDDFLQTNIPGIYALGDINGKGAFTHTSYYDYEIVRDNYRGDNRKVSDRIPAYAVFIDPPLGRVGLSEKETIESGQNVLKSIRPMQYIGRALEQSETQGFIKMLVDADSEQIIGAAVLGYHGDDVVQAIGYFMAAGASYKVMRNALPIHPTIAEQLPTVLANLEPLN